MRPFLIYYKPVVIFIIIIKVLLQLCGGQLYEFQDRIHVGLWQNFMLTDKLHVQYSFGTSSKNWQS